MSKFIRRLLKHYRFFIPLALLFFATSVYFLLRSDVFLLRELTISKHTEGRFVTEGELKDQLSTYLARSMLTINTRKVQSKLLNENLALREVVVNKNYPDKLVIDVWERVPVAVIADWVVDENGLLFHAASSRHRLNLPQMEVTQGQNYRLGDKLAGEVIKNSLQIIETLQKSEDDHLQTIQLAERGILEIQTQSGARILLDSGKNVDTQIASLQSILKDAKISGRQIAKIDLRFTKPVVVYK